MKKNYPHIQTPAQGVKHRLVLLILCVAVAASLQAFGDGPGAGKRDWSASLTRFAPATALPFTEIDWKTAAAQPHRVYEAQGEAVNGKLYTFGGFDSQKACCTPTDRAYVYDPGTDKWAAIAPMPPMNGTSHGGVTHAGITTDGTDIYLAGGYTSNAAGTGQMFGTREVWKYMVAENRYERLPDLPIVISAGQLEYLNGKLHHIAGTNTARNQDLGNHYVLDLSNLAAGWSTLAPLPNPRQHAGSAVYDGMIYFFGGQTGHDHNLKTSKEVHRYDPGTDTWAKMADLPTPPGTNGRGHISSSVVVLEDRIIVLGGETVHSSGRTSMVSAYTPATNTWQDFTPLPQNRFSGVAAVSGGILYYTGGSNSTVTFAGAPSSQASSPTAGPYMVVDNLDRFPAADHLTFSRIQVPWRRRNDDGTYTPYNANHDSVTVRISNKGAGTLTVQNLTFSNPGAWKIASLNKKPYDAAALPITLASGASVEAVIAFVGEDLDTRVTVIHDTLYITSNDGLAPTKKVHLHGLWQLRGEGNNEPNAQQIIDAFGFKTRTGFGKNDPDKGNPAKLKGDEILSPYFVRADASKPVFVRQMAAYHQCCTATENFRWHAKGSTTKTMVFGHTGVDGQTLLPRRNTTNNTPSQGTFAPTGPFGVVINRDWTDPELNPGKVLGVRIWKAIDANGHVIPNAYIMANDYLGTDATNFDYQDNLYYISNIRPEVGPAFYSELKATPSAVSFGSVLVGDEKTVALQLNNLGQTYPGGGSDPALTISRIEIVGPDKTEFTAAMPAPATLAPQAQAALTIGFRPVSRGLKNAALLVYYPSADSPLRVPLYGIADDNEFTIGLVKRIKGAANASVTIGSNVWEPDQPYRKGNIKIDVPNPPPAIAGTDDDVLYQTYLSSNANLNEIRYEVPLANGDYLVRLHFVENYWSASGARVFSVKIENELRLANLDIYREVGPYAALVRDFAATVTDGVLHLTFNPTADRLALAGVEIYKPTATPGNITSVGNPLDPDPVSRLRVYPNPANGDQVTLQIEKFRQREEVEITLHDVTGRLLLSRTLVTDADGGGRIQLPLNKNLAKGITIVRARAASATRVVRLMVE